MMADSEYSDDVLDDDIVFGFERILYEIDALVTSKEIAEERGSI